MKLRNKKTGEVMGLSMAGDIIWVGNYRYASLAELNADWEDYEPIEPLFTRDVAQMFRLWAEIHELRVVNCKYICDGIAGFVGMKGSVGEYVAIDIPETNMSKRITVGTEYSIAELCGEEEAPEPLEPTFVDMDERIKEKEGQTKKNNITLGEPGSLDMVADFETGQVRLCAAGDSYYDNFVSFDDFLGFAEKLKEALEEKK